jgi:hypothetical protein
MSIQPSPANGAPDMSLAKVIPLPGVVLAEQPPAEDIHVHTLQCSPLYRSTALRGRLVADPAEVAAIRRRVLARVAPGARRGAARRLARRIRGGAA